MSEAKSMSGGCHCGAVRFEATTGVGEVMACNCSLCAKTGWLLTFVPANSFKLIAGADHLTDYQFNRKTMHHVFCKTCGVHSFSRGQSPKGGEMYALNVRCLDDVDVNGLPVKHVDGKSF